MGKVCRYILGEPFGPHTCVWPADLNDPFSCIEEVGGSSLLLSVAVNKCEVSAALYPHAENQLLGTWFSI